MEINAEKRRYGMEFNIGGKNYKLPWEYFIAALLVLLTVLLIIITNYSRIKETWIDFTDRSDQAAPVDYKQHGASTEKQVDYYEDLVRENDPGRKEAQEAENNVEGSKEKRAAELNNPANAKHEESNRVNINKAGLEELMSLPSIGEVKAKAIMEYRKSIGRFSDIGELLNVKGIGAKTLEKIRPYITVD
mgnify:CR=1 FL=1